MLLAGQDFGTYRIVAPLGSGGMGDVYLAEDLRLHRKAAVKVLPQTLAADEVSRKRLLREARAAATLDHPNICTIYDVGEVDGRSFIAMQYVEGETLASRLHRPLATREGVKIATQLVSALDAAHQQGIIHRDVKPQNVILTPSGQVKVLDFGLAKIVSPGGVADATATNLTADKAIAGTIPYMAPEQLRGEPVDMRSDIFSFGVVFYQLLGGPHPFARDSAADTIAAILDPEPPSVERLDAPAELRRIARKCLEKDRDRRYQSMRDLAIDLDTATRDMNTTATAVAAVPRRSRWRPIAAAGVALLLVGAAIAAYLGLRERPLHVSATQFLPLTDFPDSVAAPSLSPDGSMVTFIRGGDWFLSSGQIYVKVLPDGDAKQLTSDTRLKYGPVFAPDGSSVAYTAGPGETADMLNFDTFSVPVLGGEPSLLMPNASGLTWLDRQHVLFSEMPDPAAMQMGVVTSTLDRGQARRIYFPQHQRAMAHYAVASPDRRSVLVIEMDGTGIWQPCRLVPFDGGSPGNPVGPNGPCSAAAWSPDGRYMYFSAIVEGRSHLWRQRFPSGTPEQITGGSATQEQGVAVAPDGRSLVTAVGQDQSSLWLHDASGDRLLPLEGRAANVIVSKDGRRAYCLVRKGNETTASGVTVIELPSGRTTRLLTDYAIDTFDQSDDAQAIVFATGGPSRQLQVWIAALDRRTAPRLLAANADSPFFAGAAEVTMRTVTETRNFAERIALDGSNRHHVIEAGIVDLNGASPDGRWSLFGMSTPGATGFSRSVPVASDGGAPKVLCGGFCSVRWAPDGRRVYVGLDWQSPARRTLAIPLPPGQAFPDFPADNSPAVAAWERLPGVQKIERSNVFPSSDPAVYLFHQGDMLSNLFRVPLG